METRLDRIEKALETLLVGITELKGFQKKTDEQLSRTDAQILDLKESQKKTDEQMRRTDAKLDRVGKQLADQGLVQGEVAVLTQTDEGGATLINREDFEPKAFS